MNNEFFIFKKLLSNFSYFACMLKYPTFFVIADLIYIINVNLYQALKLF